MKENQAEGKKSGDIELPCALTELTKKPITGWAEKCEDPDLTEECEFFDTRQAFLSLCVGNHYQFDQVKCVHFLTLFRLLQQIIFCQLHAQLLAHA